MRTIRPTIGNKNGYIRLIIFQYAFRQKGGLQHFQITFIYAMVSVAFIPLSNNCFDFFYDSHGPVIR